MSYELFIALRYLKSKRKTGFISLISYISIAGVVIGVAALIIVLSVMNGFESEVRSRFIGTDSHVNVRGFHHKPLENYRTEVIPAIEDIPHIVAKTPYIKGKGLILSGEENMGILIRGVDSETVDGVYDVSKNINFGRMEMGKVKGGDGKNYPGIVLGFHLADKLVVTLGDKVNLASFAGITRIGQMPNMASCIVTGYFETGLYDFDANMVYISNETAQKLFRMGDKVSGVGLKLDSYENANVVADEIRRRLGYPNTVETWFDLNPNLFAWMKIEKWGAFVILSLIIMVAAFNIVSTLIMVTMEKTKEIGILKSMGATSASIRKVFTFEGLFVGVAGTLIGSFLGYSICWAQMKYKFFALPMDVYIINWLPILMKWTDFVFIAVASILITYVASVYPAHKAAKLDPVTSIRYE